MQVILPGQNGRAKYVFGQLARRLVGGQKDVDGVGYVIAFM